MFDIAWSELLIIAIIALIVIGPKELPEVMRSLARTISKVRRSADDFRRQFDETLRDSGYEDIQRNLQDLRQLSPANQIREGIDRALNSETYPKPLPPAVDAPPVVDAPAQTPALPADEGRQGRPFAAPEADATPVPAFADAPAPQTDAATEVAAPTPAQIAPAPGSASIFRVPPAPAEPLEPVSAESAPVQPDPVRQAKASSP